MPGQKLSEFGYFGGGYQPTRVSTIDRLDFSNETVSAPGNDLTQARNSLAAVSNSNYGYFAGGFFPPNIYYCTIDRLDFSSETVSAPGNNLTQARFALAAVSNSNYGYFAGGFLPPTSCRIDRLDFSNETVDVPGTLQQLTQARSALAAVSNSNYGYFGGGSAPPYVCTIDRLDFSNETVLNPNPGTYQLTQARLGLAAVSNSNYGYFGGGYTVPPLIYFCTIDRLDFSNETVAAPGNYQLTQARSGLRAVSNSQYGYFGGGGQLPVTYYSTIDRLDFSNETTSAPGNNLTQARSYLAGLSTKPTTETVRKLRRGEFDSSGLVYSNYGYFAGGGAPTAVNTIDRLDFSNETVAAPGTYQLTQARYHLRAVSNSNYGYFAGGEAPPGRQCTIDRLDFSNETVAAPGISPGQLTRNNIWVAAVSSPQYGYFGGGFAPISPVSTIDRLDFSNETVSAPGAYQLTQEKYGAAGVSNSDYGYFAGGTAPPGNVCTIDRLDFSNETVLNPNPGTYQLTQARNELAAVSNSNYGYFAGGTAPPGFVNTIDRLDFSNETTSAPSNNLTQARLGLAAVSSSNYGYFAGGLAPPIVNTIDRLDFSNETTSAPGNNLTQTRYSLAGTNIPLNQTRHVAPQAVVGVSTFFHSYGKSENTVSYGFGYFGGGGGAPGLVCTIDRLDFSSETVTGGINLTEARSQLAAVSNSNYGYFGAGSPPGYACTIDRLDFSNETVSLPGNNLTEGRNGLTAVYSPKGYGYFVSGLSPSVSPIGVCIIDRLDFSNETVSLPGNNLSQGRWALAAVSNSNYGYFGGGQAPSIPGEICTIDRLDFSNETVLNPNPGTYQLTKAREASGGVSSPQYGYFGGGYDPPTIFSIIDRLDFSNETVSVSAPGKLTQARYYSTGVSSPQYGYFGGGFEGVNFVCTIDRLDFYNETTSAPGNNLTKSRYAIAGTQVNYYQKVGRPTSKAYGYFGGGIIPSVNFYNTIDRLDFSNETVSAPGNNLTQARSSLAAVSNSNYGYFGGGSPPQVCTIDRLDFSNETVAAPGNYQLTEARNGLAGVSNSNYGYFGGGNTIPGRVCTIDRLDFSNETTSEPGNNLTQRRDGLAAVSTSQYGYFAGGTSPGLVCTIDRLDFSNETIQFPITVEQLTQARYQLAAVSNSNYGYFAAGQAPSDACIIDRLDFSSETLSLPGNNLPKAKIGLAGVSNSNYGYFGGGIDQLLTPPGVVSTIDRLDFSNETVAAPGAYQLTQARQSPGAVSN